MRMRYLTTAHDIGELAIIKSLCEANGMPCLFQDEHVSSLYPGVLEMRCQVMVDESEWERADMLLSRLRLPIREVAPASYE
jgi:Putative prokaryotic signal transducing protein